MPNYQLFDRFDRIDIDKFIYRLVDDSLEIRIEPDEESMTDIEPGSRTGIRPSRIYLKTPVLQLGPICTYKGQTYLELNLIEDDTAFKDFLQTIDTYHLAQIHTNQKIWGYDDVPLAYFSDHYYPLIKRSATTYQDCLIVKVNSQDSDTKNVNFYDQEDNPITLNELQAGNSARAILELSNLRPINQETFQTELSLIQLKVRIEKTERSNVSGYSEN